MSETRNLDLLLHAHYSVATSGNLAQGAIWNPSPASLSTNIPTDEVWEVMSHPVVAFNGGGVAAGAALQEGHLKLIMDDGDQPVPYLNYNIAPDLNFNPPAPYFAGEPQPLMAEGIEAAIKAQLGGAPLAEVLRKACSLKPATSLTFSLTAVTAITSDIDVKIYGRRWKRDALGRVMNGVAIGGKYAVRRKVEDNSISFDIPAVATTFENWDKLFGGANAGSLTVNPYSIFAINSAATTPQVPYAMSYRSGQQAQVASAAQEQDWRYTASATGGNRVLQIDRLGGRSRWQYATGAGTNLRYAYVNLDSDVVHKRHPAHLLLVTDTDNVAGFGLQQPFGPANGLYRRVPRFDLTVFNDHGFVAIQDNGAPVGVGQAATQVQGYLIVGYPEKAAVITRSGKAA